jgi:hypothetical protein
VPAPRVTWQILDEDGDTLGKGGVQGVGSDGELHDFSDRVSLPDTVNARGAHVLLQVFGDDPSGQHPPGPDLNQVRLTLFTGLRAWQLYEVVRGDTVSAIARDQGQNTTVADIFEANRHREPSQRCANRLAVRAVAAARSAISHGFAAAKRTRSPISSTSRHPPTNARTAVRTAGCGVGDGR